MENTVIEASENPSQDSKNLALLNWIGTLFFGFIPCLIFFLVKKDDAFVQSHAKEALNWSITVMIGYVVGLILSLVVVGVLVIAVIGLCQLIFCIMAAIAASKGEEYKAPFAIRLIK